MDKKTFVWLLVGVLIGGFVSNTFHAYSCSIQLLENQKLEKQQEEQQEEEFLNTLPKMGQ